MQASSSPVPAKPLLELRPGPGPELLPEPSPWPAWPWLAAVAVALAIALFWMRLRRPKAPPSPRERFEAALAAAARGLDLQPTAALVRFLPALHRYLEASLALACEGRTSAELAAALAADERLDDSTRQALLQLLRLGDEAKFAGRELKAEEGMPALQHLQAWTRQLAEAEASAGRRS